MKNLWKFFLVSTIMISLYGCTQKRVINFEKELNVNFTGSNGNSIVTITPKPNGEIQKFKEDAEIDYQRVSKGEPLNPETDKFYAIKEGYFYTCSTDADLNTLKNGDKITYTCSVPDDFEKEFNLKIEGTTFDVIVSGLQENKSEDNSRKPDNACDTKGKC